MSKFIHFGDGYSRIDMIRNIELSKTPNAESYYLKLYFINESTKPAEEFVVNEQYGKERLNNIMTKIDPEGNY